MRKTAAPKNAMIRVNFMIFQFSFSSKRTFALLTKNEKAAAWIFPATASKSTSIRT
jgi:hypothetical protein